MLRLLIVGTTMLLNVAVADVSDLESAERQADAVQADSTAALAAVDAVDVTETPPTFDEASRRAATLPAGDFTNLGVELTDPETLSTIADLLDNAQDLAAELGMAGKAGEGLSVYVFASFSLPDASLRSLIKQGELAGVPIVLRGLVNNSIADTMQRVHSLYKGGEKQDNGAVIDPTLFERFGVDQVPTVVVADSTAGVCTPEACPTPAHVKIAGDVPLRYALDRIATAAPQYRAELRALMKTLEPEREW